MREAVKTVGMVLAGADIVCFVLLLSKAVRKISGLSGVKGIIAGLGGAAAFTAFMLFMLRDEVVELLMSRPDGACGAYLMILAAIVGAFMLTREKKERLTIEQLDELEGSEFENVCAGILLDRGFTDIELTKASGDFGVDILAVYEGQIYGIQCKRYSSRLDSKPVQEVAAGVTYYGCDVGAVMTNSTLTPHAAELAEAAGIEVWDRDTLTEWLEEAE